MNTYTYIARNENCIFLNFIFLHFVASFFQVDSFYYYRRYETNILITAGFDFIICKLCATVSLHQIIKYRFWHVKSYCWNLLLRPLKYYHYQIKCQTSHIFRHANFIRLIWVWDRSIFTEISYYIFVFIHSTDSVGCIFGNQNGYYGEIYIRGPNSVSNNLCTWKNNDIWMKMPPIFISCWTMVLKFQLFKLLSQFWSCNHWHISWYLRRIVAVFYLDKVNITKKHLAKVYIWWKSTMLTNVWSFVRSSWETYSMKRTFVLATNLMHFCESIIGLKTRKELAFDYNVLNRNTVYFSVSKLLFICEMYFSFVNSNYRKR